MNPRTTARYENVPDRPGAYVYRIIPTGRSSASFGPCEVCETPCSEVFYQVEGRTYDFARATPEEFRETNLARWSVDVPEGSSIAITHLGCRSLFGHEECLRGARR